MDLSTEAWNEGASKLTDVTTDPLINSVIDPLSNSVTDSIYIDESPVKPEEGRSRTASLDHALQGRPSTERSRTSTRIPSNANSLTNSPSLVPIDYNCSSWIPNSQMVLLSECCNFDQTLSAINSGPTDGLLVRIDAYSKTIEATSSYISYTVTTNITPPESLPSNGSPLSGYSSSVNRRYSEFEALHQVLTKLHPTCVVPPIPVKTSIVEYAMKAGRLNDDIAVIDIRCCTDVVLRRNHILHLFITANRSWSDILNQSGHAHLLKLREPTAGLLDKVSAKTADPNIASAQYFTRTYTTHIKHLQKLQTDQSSHAKHLSKLYTALGSAYNAFSLSDPPTHLIEQIGESFDTLHTLNSSLVSNLDTLSQDYYSASVGYGQAVTNVIKKIVRQSVRQDTSEDAIAAKKDRLYRYETSEEEALRIGVVLEAESQPRRHVSTDSSLLSKMNALLDRDPVLTRRNSISRLRDEIASGDIENLRGRGEVSCMKEEVLVNLGLFQGRKEADARAYWKQYALGMAAYHARVRDTFSATLGAEDLN